MEALFDGSRVEGRTLYPLDATRFTAFDGTKHEGELFAEFLLERVRRSLAEHGDRPWLANGSLAARGASGVFGPAGRSMAEVEPRARQLARVRAARAG